MDGFEKKIKKVLDEHAFNKLNLTETESANFAVTVVQKSVQTKPLKRLRILLPAAAVIFVLLLSGILYKTFFPESTNQTASIEEKAELVFGEHVFVPEISGYDILFSSIAMSPIKESLPIDLTISYGKEKGELDPNFKSEKQREKWQEEQDSILLAGPYNGVSNLKIQFRQGSGELSGSEVKDKVINGLNVQYEYLQRDAGEFVIALIDSGKGSYSIEMFLSKEFTLEDSDNMLEEITKQLQER